jgi:hypothetical protein
VSSRGPDPTRDGSNSFSIICPCHCARASSYASVFKYYGNAIEDGIEPIAFLSVTSAAVILAAFGAWLFERRDLSA